MTEDRYIEHSFPIVQLNPLSVRERNAFKPIYKMHKWFARRSSSIFRAILLASALPYKDEVGNVTDLMKEFYKGHGEDLRMRRPDGSRLRVLDPFMGGGTTVVEALRLGFDVTGGDYNPISWFIVKGETTPVEPGALGTAFDQVAAAVREELLNLYKTDCPVTGEFADIVYGFWVKHGICVDPQCNATTKLFKDYVVGQVQGDLGIKYVPGVECSRCDTEFDWELERASITAGGPQIAGHRAMRKGGPTSGYFAFGIIADGVDCPSCGVHIPSAKIAIPSKPPKKKVVLRVLLDPSTGDFFEVRGDIPEIVTAPVSGHMFKPLQGPVRRGKFTCCSCGRTQSVVDSARNQGSPLPFSYYGLYAKTRSYKKSALAAKSGLIANGGKWFARTAKSDLQKVATAAALLEEKRGELFLPNQEIVDGYNTNRLVIHQYATWADTYGPRQLYCLGVLLRAICSISDTSARDLMLGAFQSAVGFQSMLARYSTIGNKVEGVQAGHDYRNPSTAVEVSVFGAREGLGRGTFINCVRSSRLGMSFLMDPDLLLAAGGSCKVNDHKPEHWSADLRCKSATESTHKSGYFDIVITDPPYAGAVQYAEMSDWSYAWLHHALKDQYSEFMPELTLKSEEIIEDGSNKDAQFFFTEITKAWKECHRVLKDDGLLAFTFHHAEGDRWTGLLTSLFDAGFYLIAAYPTHSEALNSIVIQATKGITYDIIHVCRKRLTAPEPIPWSRLRREVRKQAREQLTEIEQGKDVLPGPDVQMILIGRALMLFSRHYGKVLDRAGNPMDLDEAMERILLLVREVRGEELPLPGKLQNIDSLSQIVLLHVVGKDGWSRDGLHKELRGYKHGPKALLDAKLVRRVADEKAKLEPVPHLVRYAKARLAKQAGGPLIDKVHLVLGTVEEGHPIDVLMDAWRGQWEQISEALAWLAKAEAPLKDLVGLARRQIEGLGPEALEDAKASQLGLFPPTDDT